nr:DUF3265 domain-containing protein [Enterovibrio norvegicus]
MPTFLIVIHNVWYFQDALRLVFKVLNGSISIT